MIAGDKRINVLFGWQVWRAKPLNQFEPMPIAPEFHRYPAEQSCSTSVAFAARPATASTTA